MDFNFYTSREVNALVAKGETSFINSLKVRVAKQTDNVEEWSARYFAAEVILNALTTIAKENTCDRTWNWHVPRSPTNLYTLEDGKRKYTPLRYILESPAVLSALPAIYDRPRRELLDTLSVLGAGTDNLEGNLTYLEYEIGVDMNKHYIRLMWSCENRPGAVNTIYLHRGRKENLK